MFIDENNSHITLQLQRNLSQTCNLQIQISLDTISYAPWKVWKF